MECAFTFKRHFSPTAAITYFDIDCEETAFPFWGPPVTYKERSLCTECFGSLQIKKDHPTNIQGMSGLFYLQIGDRKEHRKNDFLGKVEFRNNFGQKIENQV